MAVGDLKGEECVVITVTAGTTVTKGQVVHLEADGKWDPAVLTDAGKFGVAITGGADTETISVCIWGRVEVTSTAATIAKGATVMAGSTGLVVASDYGVYGETLGTAMEAIGSSSAGTVWIGLVN
ncbi:capsid cement protein [Methanolobus psychrotolerans]|uniref:capsid cement protein n=1 Tax=Methanolobus psychrotolerans TaxID=1874706 RepID=UPI000B91AE1D|nr:capsid cement protein [Methanolobus psychrotolerans]